MTLSFLSWYRLFLYEQTSLNLLYWSGNLPLENEGREVHEALLVWHYPWLFSWTLSQGLMRAFRQLYEWGLSMSLAHLRRPESAKSSNERRCIAALGWFRLTDLPDRFGNTAGYCWSLFENGNEFFYTRCRLTEWLVHFFAFPGVFSIVKLGK